MTEVPKISTIKRTHARTMSPEARQKLSDQAKARHADGSFVMTPERRAKAAATRRRNRRKTAADHVAEAAALNAEAITKVFKDAIAQGQPMGTRLKAAQAWIEVESENRKLEIKQEAEDAKQHSRDELIAILAEKLTAGPAADMLRKQLGDGVIEGTVVAEDVVPAQATS